MVLLNSTHDPLPAAAAALQLGMEIQQSLVNTAEFLGVEVAVVDAGVRACGLEPADRPHRPQQETVAQLASLQRLALRFGEQAAQAGQSQR
jgi:hypothetical protein